MSSWADPIKRGGCHHDGSWFDDDLIEPEGKNPRPTLLALCKPAWTRRSPSRCDHTTLYTHTHWLRLTNHAPPALWTSLASAPRLAQIRCAFIPRSGRLVEDAEQDPDRVILIGGTHGGGLNAQCHLGVRWRHDTRLTLQRRGGPESLCRGASEGGLRHCRFCRIRGAYVITRVYGSSEGGAPTLSQLSARRSWRSAECPVHCRGVEPQEAHEAFWLVRQRLVQSFIRRLELFDLSIRER